MEAKERSFRDIMLGDQAFFEKNITSEDITKFSDICGDHNPLHTQKKVVHGMFLGALVSRLIGMDLPGRHSLLLKEALEFRKPTYAGDKLQVAGKVVFKSEATKIIELMIEIHNNKQELVASGSAHVKVLR